MIPLTCDIYLGYGTKSPIVNKREKMALKEFFYVHVMQVAPIHQSHAYHQGYAN